MQSRLQLPYVISELEGYKLSGLILMGWRERDFILLRLIWMYPGAYIANLIEGKCWGKNGDAGPKQIFVVGWTGMRAWWLCAAIRCRKRSTVARVSAANMIIFSDVRGDNRDAGGTGLTLPPLIRALGWQELKGSNDEEHKARQKILRAALERLNEERAKMETIFRCVHNLPEMYKQDEKYSSGWPETYCRQRTGEACAASARNAASGTATRCSCENDGRLTMGYCVN